MLEALQSIRFKLILIEHKLAYVIVYEKTRPAWCLLLQKGNTAMFLL